MSSRQEVEKVNNKTRKRRIGKKVLKILPYLREVSIFSKLVESDYIKLLESIKTKKVVRDEVVFNEGDKGDAFYIIAEGKINLFKNKGNADSQMLIELTSGDVFGEMALVEEKPRSATAIASKDGLILYILKNDFDMLLNIHPSIGLKIMRQLLLLVCSRLRITSDVLISYTGE